MLIVFASFFFCLQDCPLFTNTNLYCITGHFADSQGRNRPLASTGGIFCSFLPLVHHQPPKARGSPQHRSRTVVPFTMWTRLIFLPLWNLLHKTTGAALYKARPTGCRHGPQSFFFCVRQVMSISNNNKKNIEQGLNHRRNAVFPYLQLLNSLFEYQVSKLSGTTSTAKTFTLVHTATKLSEILPKPKRPRRIFLRSDALTLEFPFCQTAVVRCREAS